MPQSRKNPIENANILSYCTFAWFVPTIFKGYRKQLTEKDLFATRDDQRSSYLGDILEESWTKERTKPNPSLLRAIWRIIAPSFMKGVMITMMVEIIVRPCQGLSFIMLLRYFSQENPHLIKTEAYIYATLLLVTSTIVFMGMHLYGWHTQVIAMKVRVACSSLIYRKALRLSKRTIGYATIGHLINLMTSDVGRFDLLAVHLQSLWFVPCEVIIVMVMLYIVTGWTGTAGLLIVALIIAIQVIAVKKMLKVRLQAAKLTDERIKIMNEIISGMRIIKMYAWEKYLTKLINKIRSAEINKIQQVIILISTSSALFCLPKLGILISIVGYVLMGNTLTPAHVFSVVIFHGTLRVALNYQFPTAAYRFGETMASIKRIQNFLQIEEMNEYHVSSIGNKPICIELRNATAKWQHKSIENTVKNVSIKINRPSLVAIMGAVGSGKSSLLNIILKELPLNNGQIIVSGSVSYSGQEAWFFRGTIKENIVFGQPYNENRYQMVIKICALETDLLSFINGDQTSIVEDGTNLSGGQRARINLARAVYRISDIYLLDDPLSAVDANVAEIIFNLCISEYLKDKIVILVTNQLQFLNHVDYVYVLKNGKLITEGTYEKLRNEGFNFHNMLSSGNRESKLYVRDEEHQANTLKHKKKEVNEDETRNYGTVSCKVYKQYLAAAGNICMQVSFLLLAITQQIGSSFLEWEMSYWSSVDSKLNVKNITLNGSALTRHAHVTICSSATIVVLITAIMTTTGYSFLFVNASANLHTKIFEKLMDAPMRFFQLNPSGRILNRFSRDLGLVDEYLPIIFIEIILASLLMLGVVVLIGVVNYWFSLIITILIVLFYIFRMVYLPSSVAIKRLEGITKSPIYTHMKITFTGLPIIRTFKKQCTYRKMFDHLQDIHTSSWFMHLSSMHTFGNIIDGLCIVAITIIVFIFLESEDVDASIFGLAVTQLMPLLTSAQWCVRQTCEMSVVMTSVERMVEYLDLEIDGEEPKRTKAPSKLWPEVGEIEFRNVFLRYHPSGLPALKNMSFKIKPGQKVGIVGRTGAGKSSICSALFQLASINGCILIDGIDISKIPLNILRPKISIIPQEPLLFSETIRRNLDPSDEFGDHHLWKALHEVGLKEFVSDMPKGLMSKIITGGANLSIGQKQLLCLARMIVKKNKILILDEATANIDLKTDAVIQATIRRKFRESTVLVIAHRMHGIINSDLVLVLDAGTVKEFDHPYVLLQNRGMFFELVKKTGHRMAEQLHQTAKNAYESKYSYSIGSSEWL